MNHQDTPPRKIQHRRRHPLAFKTQVLSECQQPGVSVAAVALRHGINQNMIYTWRRAVKRELQNEFVRLPPPLPTLQDDTPSQVSTAESATVRIDLPLPSGHITVHWPLSEMGHSTDWLKALMQ